MVAVESRSRLFVLQLANGSAWLFSQHSGTPVQVGELLMGYVDTAGFRVFAHGGGFCRAYREEGPLRHAAASGLALVRGAAPATALAMAPPVSGEDAGQALPLVVRKEHDVH